VRLRVALLRHQACWAALVLTLGASSAFGQTPADAADARESAPADLPTEPTLEDPVGSGLPLEAAPELDPEDDDIRWLYSDADEYVPSSLGGKPIAAPALPSRSEGSRRRWRPEWRRFAIGNYILTGVTLAIGAGASAIPPRSKPWTKKNPVDEWGRENLGLTGYNRSGWAQDTSDVLLSVLISSPLLVDALAATYWYRDSHAVAGQMALITAEAYGVASAVQGVTAGFASRERPYGRDCGEDINAELDDCDENKRYRSFFSGHTTLAFTAAGVTCTHHSIHDVFGSPFADGMACATALVTAGAVGTFRIVGDQHYVTDVAVGAAVGTLSGFGIPWLLHYGPLARVQKAGARRSFDINLVGVPNGLGVGGQF
jgi:membrane-associated phospholipid phosphatase